MTEVQKFSPDSAKFIHEVQDYFSLADSLRNDLEVSSQDQSQRSLFAPLDYFHYPACHFTFKICSIGEHLCGQFLSR